MKFASITAYCMLAATLAFAAGKDALGNITADLNAAMTYSVSPGHPEATLAKAQSLINSGKKGADLNEAARFAKASLRAQAINPAALNVLGYTLSEGKITNIARARKIETLAYRTSRRDINVIRWMIADGERRGDLPAILRYYDNGMRLGPEAQEILFPRLTLAMGITDFHPMFRPYIKNNAPWLASFLGYNVYNSKTPDKVAEAIMMAGGLPKNDEKYRGLEGSLLNTLVAQSFHNTAQRYYISLDKTKAVNLSSLALTQDNVNPLRAPITWQPVNTAAAGGDFSASPIKGKMTLQGFVLPSGNGNIATKLLYLTPGSYTFKASREIRLTGENALVTVKLNCLSVNNTQTIWNGDLLSNKGYEPISVPANCPAQSFVIWLSGGDGQNGTELSISEMAITPAK